MIYLDYAATTPCAPEVVDAMLPFFSSRFANASSIDHIMGADARKAVEEARGHVAALVGANEEDVVFTSGSTEANNLVLRSSTRRVLTSAVEHPSVIEPSKARESSNVCTLPVNGDGVVEPDVLRQAMCGGGPSLVSLMHTNNETGSVNDVLQLGTIAAENDGRFHTDLTQGVLMADFSIRRSPINAVSISAHKIYGPKGVGVLICTPRIRKELDPILLGGGHERALRSGTLNVPGIVGMGAAARLLRNGRAKIQEHVSNLRSQFCEVLGKRFSGTYSINGQSHSGNHILSIRMHGVNNRALLRVTGQEVCFALGSACATNKNEPSYVLRAMGLNEQACNETIRISLGSPTTSDEIVHAATAISNAANLLLEMVA